MSQTLTLNKDRPERTFILVGNGEASGSLPAKEPVCFVMNGTKDGLNVVKAVTGAAAKATTLFAGVLLKSLAQGDVQPSLVYGMVDDVVLVRATRAASTASYASAPAVAIGDILNVATLGNGLSRSAAGAASANLAFAVAGETLASIASAASTTSDTSTRKTTAAKVFIRAM